MQSPLHQCRPPPVRVGRTGGINHVEEVESSVFEDPTFSTLPTWSSVSRRAFVEHFQQVFLELQRDLFESCCAFLGVCFLVHLRILGRHSFESHHQHGRHSSCKFVDNLLLLELARIRSFVHCLLRSVLAFSWNLFALDQERVVAQERLVPHNSEEKKVKVLNTCSRARSLDNKELKGFTHFCWLLVMVCGKNCFCSPCVEGGVQLLFATQILGGLAMSILELPPSEAIS